MWFYSDNLSIYLYIPDVYIYKLAQYRILFLHFKSLHVLKSNKNQCKIWKYIYVNSLPFLTKYDNCDLLQLHKTIMVFLSLKCKYKRSLALFNSALAGLPFQFEVQITDI